MADYVVKGESLAAVADAIREKTGETDALGLGEMPGKVGEVYDTGLHAMDGEAQNQTELINQIADVLQNKSGTYYDAFWDAYLNIKGWTSYSYLFAGYGWNNKTFNPPRGTVISFNNLRDPSANNMFMVSGITDLKALCDERGITIDFSAAKKLSQVFTDSLITTTPVIDTRNTSDLTYLFYNATKMVTVEAVVLRDDGSQTFGTGTFANCGRLENIVFRGAIGQNGFNVSPCPLLTHDSLMSILNALKDYAGSGMTYTCTLGTANLAKLTDAEKQIATQKGWTLA